MRHHLPYDLFLCVPLQAYNLWFCVKKTPPRQIIFFRGSYLRKGKERAMQHELTSVTHGLSQKTNKREASWRREGASSADRGKKASAFLTPSLTCPFCMCVVLVIYIHMYRASVCVPAVKICYGYSFLNVHAVRARETRIMGVGCTHVMCLSHHVMKHMVRLRVYTNKCHIYDKSHFCSATRARMGLETGWWCASVDHVLRRSHADREMRERGAHRLCDAWWDVALPTLCCYCTSCITQPCACCMFCGASVLCVLWARVLCHALILYLSSRWRWSR